MSLRSNPYQAYTRTTAPRAPRSNPEHALQVTVCQYFRFCLPPEVLWSSTLNGVYLGPKTTNDAKAAGLRKGPFDMFLVFRQRTFWLELKVGKNTLTPEQIVFRDALHPDSWAVCYSLDEVVAFLQRIGVKLRAVPDQALIGRR